MRRPDLYRRSCGLWLACCGADGTGAVRPSLTNRGLLRTVLVGFALFLAYRSLAAVVTTVLLLATGVLLAVALSAPTEALYRRKVPRAISVALIFLAGVAVLGAGGYLLFPVLAEQAAQLASALPGALSQLVERSRSLAQDFGLNIGGGGDLSPSTLASAGRRVLGGALSVFGGLASFFAGLIVLLFVPLYLAAMPGPVVGWIVRLFPPEKREGVRGLLSEVRKSLLGWLGGSSSR